MKNVCAGKKVEEEIDDDVCRYEEGYERSSGADEGGEEFNKDFAGPLDTVHLRKYRSSKRWVSSCTDVSSFYGKNQVREGGAEAEEEDEQWNTEGQTCQGEGVGDEKRSSGSNGTGKERPCCTENAVISLAIDCHTTTPSVDTPSCPPPSPRHVCICRIAVAVALQILILVNVIHPRI